MKNKTAPRKENLVPRTKIKSEGKVHYSESFQAWNTIKLKKELFSEFPQLKEKSSKFSYKMTYYRDPTELGKEIREMISGKGAVPILLWLFKDN